MAKRNLSFRKLKKGLRKKGYGIKSSKRMKAAVKRGFEGGKRSAAEIVYRGNAGVSLPFGKWIKGPFRVRKNRAGGYKIDFKH
jgi:hypothetical protein